MCAVNSFENVNFIMSNNNAPNLAKQSLAQLQELLDRQNALIRNRKLWAALKDKGESVIQLQDKIQKEIQHRKDIDSVEASLASLSLSATKDDARVLAEKHVKYVCSKEKLMQDMRYRPHRTLVDKEVKTVEKSPKKNTEVTSAYEPELRNVPTICIPLSESLIIQNEQVFKLLEEKARKAFGNFNNVEEEEVNDGLDNDEEPLEIENTVTPDNS